MAQEDSFDGKRNRLVIPRLDGLFKARETGSSAGNTAVTRLWVFLKHTTTSKRSRKVAPSRIRRGTCDGQSRPTRETRCLRRLSPSRYHHDSGYRLPMRCWSASEGSGIEPGS